MPPISGNDGSGIEVCIWLGRCIEACIALGDGYCRAIWDVEYCECSEPWGDADRSMPGSVLMENGCCSKRPPWKGWTAKPPLLFNMFVMCITSTGARDVILKTKQRSSDMRTRCWSGALKGMAGTSSQCGGLLGWQVSTCRETTMGKRPG
jgi:hypothetical protein